MVQPMPGDRCRWRRDGPGPQRGAPRCGRQVVSEHVLGEAVSDCCALNVDDTCTWACYDSDFPVVCIRGDIVTGWDNDITGARALAVAGSRRPGCSPK
jgi:hypothetical protein